MTSSSLQKWHLGSISASTGATDHMVTQSNMNSLLDAALSQAMVNSFSLTRFHSSIEQKRISCINSIPLELNQPTKIACLAYPGYIAWEP